MVLLWITDSPNHTTHSRLGCKANIMAIPIVTTITLGEEGEGLVIVEEEVEGSTIIMGFVVTECGQVTKTMYIACNFHNQISVLLRTCLEDLEVMYSIKEAM
mmetsp:Transcript_15603/g.38493  ORF Transcript_15603/g.38493 Transcript_15603/m.38493 type:complete len:102 (+) Transcript_15603:930-1235(+)